MIILEMEQGTESWKELRKHSIGSSDIPAIMGKDPYCTAYEKWNQKILGSEIQETEAMARGKRLEPEVREWFEKEMSCTCPAAVVTDREHTWMLASLDGLSPDRNTMIEIKCCKKEYYDQIAQGIVPEHFMLQIQWQMLVADLPNCHLIAYDGCTPIMILVEADVGVQFKIIEKAKEFYFRNILDCIPPELTDRDIIQRDDDEWKRAAEAFISAKKQAKAAKEWEDACHENLVMLADKKPSKGFGVCATRVLRPGAVDYKKIPELKDVDLNQYRKKSVEYWTIRTESNDE